MEKDAIDLLGPAKNCNANKNYKKKISLHGLIKSQNWCKELEAGVKNF